MTKQPCPPHDILRGFSAGYLESTQWDDVAIHVDRCDACQSVLDTAVHSDGTEVQIAQALRRPQPFLDEPECGQAIRRFEAVLPIAGSDDTDQLAATQVIAAAGTKTDQEQADGAAAPCSANPIDGIPSQLGSYRLESRIGRGGMGSVYRAVHTALEKSVALKILPLQHGQSPTAVQRFLREMKALGRMEHPHLVRATDAGEANGLYFLVMELLPGTNLAQLVKRRGPLPVAEACAIIRQAALGLQFMHEQGLIHRDIKPSNLMLLPDGQVKVVDLGLARLVESSEEELTACGQFMGTLDYMAPEQGRDSRHVDSRADVYALGATLYCLLAGHSPFPHDSYGSSVQQFLAHQQLPVPSLSNERPDMPPELESFLNRMLSKPPAERPSAAEVAQWMTSPAAGADLPCLLSRAASTAASGDPVPKERPRVAPSVQEPPTGRRALSATWLLAAFLLPVVAGTVVIIRNRDGREVFRVEVPADGSVEIVGRAEGQPAAEPLGAAITAKPHPANTDQPAPRVEVLSADPDRGVAQWVLSLNGRVTIEVDGEQRGVSESASLPADRFQVIGIEIAKSREVTDAALARLRDLTHLELLTLGGTRITDAGLSHIRDLKELKSLSITGTPITGVGLVHLEGLQDLGHLSLSWTQINDANLVHIRGMENLYSLYLMETQITDAGLRHLENLTKIRELGLRDTQITDAGLARLQGLTGVSAIFLDGTRITDRGVEYLLKFPNLRRLNLNDTRISRMGYESLQAAFPQAELHWSERNDTAARAILDVGGRVTILQDDEETIVDSREKLSTRLFDVTAIDLTGLDDLPEDLWPAITALNRSTALRRLDLSDSNVTEADLGRLAPLINVRELSLAGTSLTDDGLAPLKAWMNLVRLDLNDTAIAGTGLVNLMPLKNLKELRIGPGLTYQGLMFASQLRQLEQLSLTGSGIDEKELAALRESLPGCEVVHRKTAVPPVPSPDGIAPDRKPQLDD